MTVSYPQVTHVISGNTAGATALISSGTYNLAGGANITLSQNGNSISIVGGAGGGGTVNFSAGTTSNNLTNVVFSNSNNFSFGLNGSTITASYTVPTIPAAGSLSAGTTSATLGQVIFSNSNSVSFGMNAGTVTATVSYPAQTNQTVGIYGSSQTTGQSSSSTYDARSLTFRGAGVVSVGNSGGEIIISAVAAGGGNTGSISAGTTRGTLGEMVFSDSNGIAFGVNGQTITASHNALTSQSNQNITASNGGFAFQTLSFSNANGLSFGTSAGSAIIGSYTVPTVTNSSWTVSDSATSGTVGRLAFTNLNGVTLSLSSGTGGLHTIVGSHNALTSQSNQNVTAANGGFAFQTLSFSNVNGFSFGTSAGSAITGSYTVPTQTVQTQNVVVPAASNSTYTSGTVVFTGSNNITVSYNGQTIQISGPTTAAQTNQTLGLYAVSNTTLSSSGTVDARTLSFQGAGVASVGVSNGSVIISVPAGGGAGYSAGLSNIGNTSGDTGTVSNQLVFAGGNNITLSGSTNAGSMTITISAPNLGAGGGIAAAAGTQTATSGTVVFSNSNNMTFGMSNSSVITASYVPPGISDFVAPWAWSGRGTNSSLGQNTLYFMPVDIDEQLSASRINFYPNISISLETGNSSGTGRFGIGYGIYTRGTGASSERISLLSSYSMTFISHSNSSNNSVSLTHAFGLSNVTSHSEFTTTFATSNASTYVVTNLNGHRALPMPLNLMMTPGRYFLGVMVSRTATSAVANSLSMHITSVGVQPEVRGLGFASAATNASVFRGGLQGLGSYSATTNAFPASVALSTDNIRAAVNATLVHFDIKGYGYSSNVL